MRRKMSVAGVSTLALASMSVTSAPASGQTTGGSESSAPVAASAQAIFDPATAASGSSGNAKPAGIADIVVTARKVTENLQRVPVAVTVFNAAQLQQKNVVQVSDLSRITPGLDFAATPGNSNALQPSIRGQVQNDSVSTLDPSVGIYVDGIYWASAFGLNGNLLDLQSVQVLKGPQGTLFGRNTSGGAILFQTNDPNFRGYSGLVSASYGRFNEHSETAVLNAPLVDNVLAVRLAFQDNKRDGYVHDILNGNTYDNWNNWTARAKLLFKPTDTLSFVLSGEVYRNREAAPATRLAYVTPDGLAALVGGGAATVNAYIDSLKGHPNTTALDDIPTSLTNTPLADSPQNHYKTHTYSLTVTQETFFGAVKLIAGYRHLNGTAETDLDGSPFDIHSSYGAQDLKQKSLEAQITGRAFDNVVNFVAGINFFKETGSDATGPLVAPAFVPHQIIYLGDIDNNSVGLYGQATAHLTRKLSLTGGLRYSIDDKGLSTHNTLRPLGGNDLTCQLGNASPPDCTVGRRDSFSAISYTASLDYQLTNDILLYAKSGRGYRSGGENIRPASLATFVPFKPQYNDEQEVGFKGEFFDRHVRLNAAAYYDRISDLQQSSNVVFGDPPQSATIVQNVGKARIYGLEADLTVVPVTGLELGASGALTRPKFLVFQDAGGDERQTRFPYVPKESFNISATYSADLPVGGLQLHAEYDWQGKTALSPDNVLADPYNADIVAATTRPAGGFVNARASLSILDKRVDLAVFVRNLANNRQVVEAFDLRDPIGLVHQTLADPRTFGGSVTVKFGPQ